MSYVPKATIRQMLCRDAWHTQNGRLAAASRIFDQVFLSGCGTLPLPAPAEQTQRAEAGSEEWECGWERSVTRTARRRFANDKRPCRSEVRAVEPEGGKGQTRTNGDTGLANRIDQPTRGAAVNVSRTIANRCRAKDICQKETAIIKGGKRSSAKDKCSFIWPRV